MKAKKTSYPSIQIGSSFLLVIFIILCMVIFAVLSLSSALKDARFSRKTADRTTAYYQADADAQELLAQIDGILADAPRQSPKEFSDFLDEELAQLGGVTVSWDSAASQTTKTGQTAETGQTAAASQTTAAISFTAAMEEEQALEVRLSADRLPDSGGYYKILSWKQVSTKNWEGNTKLPVIGSE